MGGTEGRDQSRVRLGESRGVPQAGAEERVRVRDPEGLWSGVFEKVDETVGKLGAQNLFQALTVSDQTQRREFYLSKVEEVEPGLRIKLQQLYRYY
jgi:hypothetical protein